jgi:hypothetical protein
MTGDAPKWRTIKMVFSLPGSDDLEGGIFQSNRYIKGPLRIWTFVSSCYLQFSLLRFYAKFQPEII